jgi:hypothetical protein
MKTRWILVFLFLYTLTAGAQTMNSPKAECENLMDAVLPFAEQILQRNGEFFPYGGALRTTGEIVKLAGYDGSEQPPSADVIRLLKQGFIQGAKSGKYKATALVYNVRVVLPSSGEKSDAIAVSLNHRDNYSLIVFFPYQLNAGKIAFGEVFAQKGGADVFPAK